ncbi:MAG: TetR family transcriptional regulator [Eubacterium sp.]|nr:TetR family transcriptional regulator [Eubacterium sp.]
MSKNTKEALISAFLELIKEEEFDKITVTDLVEKCSISRQTFYYHFEDIHKMLSWAFEAQTKKICDVQSAENWEEAEKAFVDFLNTFDIVFRKALNSTRFIFILNLIDKSFYDCITSYIALKRSEEQNFGKNVDYVSHIQRALSPRLL